jgi:hexosaminidase
MIRKHFDIQGDIDNLRSFTKLFEPMVWDYNEIVKINDNVWHQYSSLFDKIWLAGAFKGATFQTALLPNVTKHYMNNLEWMKIIHKMHKRIYFNGIAYTGWSRYDHILPICEIIPSAIPSLVFILKYLTTYGDLESTTRDFKELSKCNYQKNSIGFVFEPTFSNFLTSKPRNFTVSDLKTYECSFPGSYLYNYLLNLKSLIDYFELKHRTYSTILNDYNLANGYINTMIHDLSLEKFYPSMKFEFELLNGDVDKYFVDYFYQDLIVEFKSVYIKPYLDRINVILNKLSSYKIRESLPVRPYL